MSTCDFGLHSPEVNMSLCRSITPLADTRSHWRQTSSQRPWNASREAERPWIVDGQRYLPELECGYPSILFTPLTNSEWLSGSILALLQPNHLAGFPPGIRQSSPYQFVSRMTCSGSTRNQPPHSNQSHRMYTSTFCPDLIFEQALRRFCILTPPWSLADRFPSRNSRSAFIPSPPKPKQAQLNVLPRSRICASSQAVLLSA